MKRSPSLGTTLLVSSLGLAAVALALAGPISCGGRKVQTAGEGQTAVQSQNQNFVVPLREQRRWNYEIDPTPALARKPAYLLKTIGFPSLGAGLDNQANAVLRDVATLMKDRPKVRVLFLGLTDRGSENVNSDLLGANRAKTARDFVTGQGIERARTEMATFGSRVALGDPRDKVSQEKDRRVEVWLIEE